MNPAPALPSDATVIADTRRWIERAVIGLNLCPFARSVYVGDRLRIVVSAATRPDELLGDLAVELTYLDQVASELVETTLLVVPGLLHDFLDFNDFLDVADDALAALKLSGTLQIASFHPDFVFAGRDPGDISHATNRSPWPCLHLLREASIARATSGGHDPASIWAENVLTMNRLGAAGWADLLAAPAVADESDTN